MGAKKRILLIGYNFSPEPTGIGKYSGEMMKWLSENESDCTVVTTYPYYPYWRVQEPYRSRRFFFSSEKLKTGSGKLRVFRCPIYIPQNPSGLKRMLQDASFFISSAIVVLFIALFCKRKDVIVAVAPSFLVGFPALLYRFLKRGKIVYHIQDLQIEAADQLDLIKSKRLIKLLYKIERFVLNRVNAVSSISEAMISKISLKTTSPIFFFPNWTDTHFFKPIEDKEALKSAFNIDPKKKVVLYSGAIGNKQGLEVILTTASQFSDQNYQFVICGTGPYLDVLKKMAIQEEMNNLEFRPLQPLEKFNDFLNMADLHLVIQKSGAGDLLLPSKLTSILSVGGLALITAQKGTTLHDLNEKYNLAVVVEPENDLAFVQGVRKALSQDDSMAEKKFNARKYAELYLNQDKIMENFLLDIDKL